MPLPRSPIEPLKNIIREGRQQVRKASDEIRSLADELHSTVGSKPAQPSPSETKTPGAGASRLTSEEILAYQNREIGRELWALEKHLTQGCLIPDKTGKPVPCDCCEKGTFISGLAYESISIAERAGKPSGIYSRIAKWCEELGPKVTVPAVESGQYDYKKISGEASALRKELMGTTAFGALLTPKERTAVAERATWILGEEEL